MGNEETVATPQDELETLDEQGNAPETRLNSPQSAFNICKRLIDRDEERSRKRAVIQGQIDGNPPYDPAELRRLGQSYRANVNYRTAESMRDARKTSYYELLLEVECLVEVKIPEYDRTEGEIDSFGRIDFGAIIADEFSKMLLRWDGFCYHTFVSQEQMVVWGVGNAYWESQVDWRFKSTRYGSFLVPDETKAYIDSLPLCCVRDHYLVHELFAYVRNESAEAAAKAEGWDTDLIKQLITEAASKSPDTDKHDIGDWESLQQKVKDNDLEYSYSDTEKVHVNHLFFKEFDGKITHVIIPDREENNKDENGEPGKFLYQKIKKYDDWKECLCLFFTNIEAGGYHSIRGLGAKIYAHCALKDRLMNGTFDGALAASAILIEPNNESQKERVRLVRSGPLAVMPAGYNAVPKGSFTPNIDGLVGVNTLLDNSLNTNVGMFRPDVTETEKTPAAQNQGEIRMRATKEAKLEKSDINMYYNYWDSLYKEILRRALNKNYTKNDPGYEYVEEFILNCTARGVPVEYLVTDKLVISASRAVGLGSPIMKELVSADILSISAYFDEQGKKNAVRDYVSARVGYQGVNRYIPTTDRNLIPSNQHSIANLENNDFQEGTPVVVGSDQPHVIHLLIHLGMLQQLADLFLQQAFQGDPTRLSITFDVAMQHSAETLDYIAEDPARETEYQRFMEQFQELAKVHELIRTGAEQAQRRAQQEAEAQQAAFQEAQQRAAEAENQVKLAEIQADTEFKMLKEQNNNQIRQIKAQHGMQIDEMKAQHAIALENAKAAAGA